VKARDLVRVDAQLSGEAEPERTSHVFRELPFVVEAQRHAVDGTC
jgi:hypothetical protein